MTGMKYPVTLCDFSLHVPLILIIDLNHTTRTVSIRHTHWITQPLSNCGFDVDYYINNVFIDNEMSREKFELAIAEHGVVA